MINLARLISACFLILFIFLGRISYRLKKQNEDAWAAQAWLRIIADELYIARKDGEIEKCTNEVATSDTDPEKTSQEKASQWVHERIVVHAWHASRPGMIMEIENRRDFLTRIRPKILK